MEKQRFKRRLSIDSITDKQWEDAFWSTAQHITYLIGNPAQGPFSEAVLGIPAKDFFSFMAFDLLFSGKKPLKEEYTLKSQMRLAARGLMSNHERLYENTPAPIYESFDDYCETLANSMDNTVMDPLDEERYAKAEAVADDDPDLLMFVKTMRICDTYDDMAEEMDIPIEQVYNLSRKLRRCLKKAGYLEI